MANAVKMRNPDTGGVGNVDVNHLQQALQDGMQLAQDVDFYNPDTKGVGKLSAKQAVAALEDGLLPVGSHAHSVATTGKLESFGRAALQGVSGGFADEISGALESAFTPKTYVQARDESRENFKTADEANPTTSLVGNLAGGFASSLVPGMGAVGKGLTGAIATGAKLGGIYGLGNSTADLTKGDVVGALEDTAKSAALGGVAGGVSDAVGKGVGFLASKVPQGIKDAVDPFLQRALAFGAKTKDLRQGGPAVDKLKRSLETFEEMGGFQRADGKLPGDKDLLSRLGAFREETTNRMKQAIDSSGGMKLDVGDVLYGLDDSAAQVIQRAPPDMEVALQGKLEAIKNRIVESEGDIGKLLQLKRDSGGWAKYDATKPAFENKLYRTINSALDDEVTAAIDVAARQVGGDQADLLSKLNGRYEAISTLEKLAFDKAAREAVSTSGTFKLGDVAGAGLGAAAGSAVGGPIGASIGYGAAALGNAAIRSTEGRLLRAEVGKMYQRKQQQDAMAVAQGSIPRTVEGVKKWATENLQAINASMPQLAPIAQRLLHQQGSAAEQTVRTMMPLLAPMMTPSAYPSEFQGKVFEPQDRFTISKQLDALPGMTLEQKAARRSALNKDGSVPPEVYVAPQSISQDDQMGAFTQNLMRMGF